MAERRRDRADSSDDPYREWPDGIPREVNRDEELTPPPRDIIPGSAAELMWKVDRGYQRSKRTSESVLTLKGLLEREIADRRAREQLEQEDKRKEAARLDTMIQALHAMAERREGREHQVRLITNAALVKIVLAIIAILATVASTLAVSGKLT